MTAIETIGAMGAQPKPRAIRATTMRRRSAIPGFTLTMGVTLAILSLVVLLPLFALVLRAATGSPEAFAAAAFSERALRAYGLSFGTALVAAAINGVLGFVTAWVLVRYRFPGATVVNALVDLPFALPTAVAGIALVALYAPNGWIGRWLDQVGIQAAFNPIGITIALTFIGLPFVVRTIEPVLRDLAVDVEEASASLGASRLHTFRNVILPALAPAWLTGFALALARGVGEYGSVIFIAGNMPYKSEIAPLLIVVQLEQYQTQGAAAIAVVMLAISFTLLLFINLCQAWSRRFA
jgi:sulfate/thiosulfate transport system permease protein